MNRVEFWSTVALLALMLMVVVWLATGIASQLSYLPKWAQIAITILIVLLVSYSLVKYVLGKEDK
ncbi:hypothetical protein AB4033_001852 [Listeria monocytogenes]|nr:hypothetical protein [Listeria monocytogenes]